MRLAFTLILSLGIFSFAFAQTSITNATFLSAGDILYTGTDNAPSIDVGSAGPSQKWSFGNLQTPDVQMREVLPASAGTAGASFPNADIVMDMFGGEVYMTVGTDEMVEVGFAGGFQGFDIDSPYNPQSIFRKTMEYGDSYSTENGIALTIPAEQIPFLDSLGLPVEPDSVRITRIQQIEVNADAWGTVILPTGTYDCLRLEKNTTASLMVEMYVPFLNWIDVTDFIAGQFGDLEQFGGGDTYQYEFLADGIKESIAIVSLDTIGGDVQSVTFKSDPNVGIPVVNGDPGSFFAAYPNPAYADVKIDVIGFERGNYDIGMYDISGKRVMNQNVNVNGDTTVVMNVSSLDKGSYLYTLVDSEGRIIKARRLMVIKP